MVFPTIRLKFGDDGKTKNGHSVVLRLKYREIRILMGGDLNIPPASVPKLAPKTAKRHPTPSNKTTKAPSAT
jgi:hypothetical protein